MPYKYPKKYILYSSIGGKAVLFNGAGALKRYIIERHKEGSLLQKNEDQWFEARRQRVLSQILFIFQWFSETSSWMADYYGTINDFINREYTELK